VTAGDRPTATVATVSDAVGEVLGSAAERRGDDAISAECQRLLEALRKQCPDVVLPGKPLPAGEVGPEIPIDRERGAALYRLVARRVAGLDPARPDAPGIVIWTQDADELAVFVDQVSVTTADGAIAVDLPVRCDETGDAEVRVRFAVGSERRPAGVLATTDERPFGPPEIVDVWGEALTSFAWQVVLRSSTGVADAAGRDADGAGLIPVGLQASADGVSVLTMARHSFDRRDAP
jgi:hypothetical protein